MLVQQNGESSSGRATPTLANSKPSLDQHQYGLHWGGGGGLPPSIGHNVIMVVVDRFNKYGHFLSLSHPYVAASIDYLFMGNIFKLHGMPQTIVSDKDPIFTSQFWKDMFRISGIELLMSSVYHPQTNGK